MKSKKIIALLAAVAITTTALPVSVMAEDNAIAETASSDTTVISETELPLEAEVSEQDSVQPASETYTQGDYEYTVNYDGVATITKYNGTARTVSIPTKLGGYPVAYIGYGAFRDNARLVNLTIGSNIKSIDDSAFFSCNNLSEVVIPDSVTYLGSYAFQNCISLKKAVIGSGINMINFCTFSGCSKLASVTIGKNVTSIKSYAFKEAGIEGTLVIPDSVTFIDERVFENCSKITDIKFGKGIKEIEDDAFKDCDSLLSVTIPDTVTSMSSCVFSYCDSLKKITFGSGMNSTGKMTCFRCPSLTDIVFNAKTTNIGYGSFSECSGLKRIVFPDTIEYIGEEAFENCSSLESINLGKGLKDIGHSAFGNCDALTEVTLPDTMLEMSGSYAFGFCDNLKTIVFGKELINVGEGAVSCCSYLTDVVIKNGVLEIGNSAFSLCESLKRIYIPSTINTISNNAFNCYTTNVNIFYGGSKADWADISVGTNNGTLSGSTIYYDCPEPVTITSLKMSDTAPVLQWTASSGAASYLIYRSEDLSGELTYLGKTTSRSFTDNSAVNGKTYYYHVMAYKDKDSFSYSIPKKIKVSGAAVTKPALPTGLKLSAGDGSITASWNAVSGATSYTVYTYLNGKYSKVATPVSTKYTITGLKNGTKYGVLVLANNAAGSSSFTANDVKFATPAAAKPALPTGLTLTPGNGSITASWKAVSGAKYYIVYTYLNGKYSKVGTPVSTKFTISGLKNGTKYGVLVLAANDAGSSSFAATDVKFATPTAGNKPALPSGLTLSAGNGSITASWKAVSGAKYYTVYTYLNGKYSKVGTPVSTKYTISGLKNGTKYGVLVLATNDAGSSAFAATDVKFATPTAGTKPALPTGLTLSAGNGSITASWKAVSGASYYTVFIYSNGKYTKVGTPVSTRYTITGLTNGTKYGVLVLATNEAGSSSFTKDDVRCATPTAN